MLPQLVSGRACGITRWTTAACSASSWLGAAQSGCGSEPKARPWPRRCVRWPMAHGSGEHLTMPVQWELEHIHSERRNATDAIRPRVLDVMLTENVARAKLPPVQVNNLIFDLDGHALLPPQSSSPRPRWSMCAASGNRLNRRLTEPIISVGSFLERRQTIRCFRPRNDTLSSQWSGWRESAQCLFHILNVTPTDSKLMLTNVHRRTITTNVTPADSEFDAGRRVGADASIGCGSAGRASNSGGARRKLSSVFALCSSGGVVLCSSGGF